MLVQIGNGSFGHVYKGYDNTLKNFCAVKVIPRLLEWT